MSFLNASTRRRPTGEDGMGMVLVVSSMLIGSMFAFAALGAALNTQNASRSNQDWNGALAAAQAGVDDYIAYLNRNDNYARTPIDCTNVAIRTPANCSMPFGWKPLDAASPNLGEYHYDIDPSKLESEGIVEVTSTGRVGSETRTLQVGVGRGGSTDFLYYTDHEDADPNNKQAYSGTMPARCAKHWWAGRRTDGSGCQEITFIGGDVLDGAVHSNDTLLMTSSGGVKPKFLQGVQTSEPRCKNAVPGTPSTYGNCDRSYSTTSGAGNYGSSWPQYADPKDLPDNSDEFRNYPGCHYQGSTRIKFQSDGTMRVWSKESTTTLTSAACGGGATAPNGAVVNVPTDQVIYVRGGTSGERQCLSGEIGDGLPLGDYTSPTKATTYPGYTYDQNMLLETQRCGKGNVYVEGVLKGRVTMAASNSITLTGDVVLADGIAGTDMLGLVAANSVEVFHPRMDTWRCTSWNSDRTTCKGSWGWANSPSEASGWPKRYGDVDNGNAPYPTKGIQVSGSIQTLQRSFFVQSYHQGPTQGTLYVRGSIAQEWRGIVGTQSCSPMCGYLKDYRYDKRLRFASPPYFPQWTNAVWASNYTGEISPLYG